MPGQKYAFERSMLAMIEAASRLGIVVDTAKLMPTRRVVGPDTLVPLSECRAVLREIFTDPRDSLGIELARVVPIEIMGLWGFLLRSSPNFGELLRRAERYIKLDFGHTSMSLLARGEYLAAICHHPYPSPFIRHGQEVSFFLGQWLTWGRSLVGDTVVPHEVNMCWEGPSDRAPFDAFFGTAVNFGAAEDSLVFDNSVLHLSLPEFTPELAEMFEIYSAASIKRLAPEASFVDQVREAISAGLLTASTTETAIAEHLGVTVRTLHRRLAVSESSFRQILNDLLRSRAEQLLCERRLPIAEVSYLLGYAEPSNFHRAFRRWTGFTPTEWRDRYGTAP